MTKDFHAEPFDKETKLKLEIFRGYIREWLPVFLAKRTFKTISLYDFFAGPGRDVRGEKGSPLIIIEEIKGYFSSPKTPKAQGVEINLYFNDDVKSKYLELKKAVEEEGISKYFNVELDNKDFTAAFKNKFRAISAADTANLVILDQSGVKHITQDVFKKIMGCRATDVLFFISSSTVKRFAGENCIDQYLPGISKEQIDKHDAGHIHRFMCNEYYRKLVPPGKEYHLAPFSIKKDSNVYGLIFGSNNLYGLEKFLRVCWNIDPKTGEANYNIDRDAFWDEKKILFKELDTVQKKEEFQRNLTAELKKTSLTNKELYRYCLESGFLPKHVNEILTILRKGGKIIVSPEDSKWFYIGWDYYSGKKDKVVTFAVKE
jgi:three-Cys-motif partner protein